MGSCGSSADGRILAGYRVMRPTSGARWGAGRRWIPLLKAEAPTEPTGENRPPAASGGNRAGAFSAAVEKPEEQRKAPDGLFGHRKAARSDNPKVVGSNPSPATKEPQGPFWGSAVLLLMEEF